MGVDNYKHIVLFKIHDHVSDDEFNKALLTLQELGLNNTEVLNWIVLPSIDVRKGRIIIEEALFIDKDAFEKFRTSEKHRLAGEMMSEIADWLVGDYLT